jgi:hypothetical protein
VIFSPTAILKRRSLSLRRASKYLPHFSRTWRLQPNLLGDCQLAGEGGESDSFAKPLYGANTCIEGSNSSLSAITFVI